MEPHLSYPGRSETLYWLGSSGSVSMRRTFYINLLVLKCTHLVLTTGLWVVLSIDLEWKLFT
jgi:hypothetical protein